MADRRAAIPKLLQPGRVLRRLGFTPAEVNAFKAGKSAVLTIVPAAALDQEVVLTLSLAGFTAGWNAVIAANAK